ncbi:hypothetical protein GF321_06365 [bacterium]|nr:hypothetical protein [bacterium]
MIWHVDETVIEQSLLQGDFPNDVSGLKGVDLEEADGVQDMDRPGGSYSFGSHYDSFREGNNDRFGGSTLPSSRGNSGIDTGIEITGISSPGTVMSFNFSRELPVSTASVSFDGSTDRLSPVALQREAGTDLIILADSGKVYRLADAGAYGWRERTGLIADFGDLTWKGGAVAGDIDGLSPVVFGVSHSGALCAVRLSGENFPIGTGSPSGILDLPDSALSLPVMIDMDGDSRPEALALSFSADSVYFNLVGADVFGTATVTGNGVLRAGRCAGGIPVSEASTGWIEENGENYRGVFVMVKSANGDITGKFWEIAPEGPELICSRVISENYSGNPGEVIPSSADLDGDGSDEMVAGLPGRGVFFWNPARNTVRIYEAPGPFSQASLADINGDGIPETAIRDRENLYLFSGEGIIEDNWPVRIITGWGSPEEGVISQPLIADISGDGTNDVVSDFYGAIHALRQDGSSLEGWPLPDAGTGTPVIIEGEDDSLSVFTAGTVMPVTGGGNRSRAVRYRLAGSGLDRGWLMFRKDPLGSSRGLLLEQPGPVAGNSGKGSFFCYPNPVEGDRFYVRARLQGPAEVRITIMNIEGEKVLELEGAHHYSEGSMVPFEKCVSVSDLAGGVYICLLRVDGAAGSWTDIRKFAIAR